MYDRNTNSVTLIRSNNDRFQSILQHAADTIAARLESYDARKDPLKESHLKLLYDIVSSEVDRVASGLGYIYAGLEPPLRAVPYWGEPPDSELVSALHKAETFFRTNYCLGRDRARTPH